MLKRKKQGAVKNEVQMLGEGTGQALKWDPAAALVFSAENAICYKMSWERLPIEIASIEGNKTSNSV